MSNNSDQNNKSFRNKKYYIISKQDIIWVGSQCIRFIPLVGTIKNLIEVLQGKDKIIDRKFTNQERIAKCMSSLLSLGSRWVSIHAIITDQSFETTAQIIIALQSISTTTYVFWIYYSGELQKILQKNKIHFYKHAKFFSSKSSWKDEWPRANNQEEFD